VSPKVVCGLCGRAFWPKRPWQRFCSHRHKRAFHAERERRHRMRRKRAQAASNASRTHSMRFTRTPLGEGRSLRSALETLALRRPEFLRRLMGAVGSEN
jgi:hypothetical protein